MIVEKLEEIISGLEEAKVFAVKVDKGKKSPGTKLRKASQHAIKSLKELRIETLAKMKEPKV